MKISNAFNNNRILRKLFLKLRSLYLLTDFIFLFAVEATNLFLRDNGRIVLDAMQSQLQKKLATEFGKLANQLLKNVPRDWFYV